MNKVSIRYNNQTKKITLPKTNSPQDLSQMIQTIFKLKQKVVGVTDEQGRFYDITFLHNNVRLLKNQQLSLVTVKDSNDQNMSFASDNVDTFEQKKQQILTHQTELFQKVTQGYLGFINDLPLFQQLFLQDKKLLIVLCSTKDKSNLKISYNFYVYNSENQSVIIYYDRKKVGELFISDWRNVQQKIDSIAKNLNLFTKESRRRKPQDDNSQSDLSIQGVNIQNLQNEMPIDEIKNTFLENIAKLRDEETISELDYYKLKAKLFENPQDFMRKYQMGTRQGFRKKKSIDELRDEIVRSKEQKSRYQTIINEFRQVRAPSQQQNFHRNYKNQIPIIVRKYNNVIQKISTSYPLNIQQQQAINLIMELQLKGLITEADSRDYKSKILQEDPEIFSLFSQYFEDCIDQVELANKLKNKKKNDKKSLEDKNRSEEIVRMIIKYAKRNSFELLRNLAIQGNSYILKCYDQYNKDKNANAFAISLQKVANFYKAKNKLEEDIDTS